MIVDILWAIVILMFASVVFQRKVGVVPRIVFAVACFVIAALVWPWFDKTVGRALFWLLDEFREMVRLVLGVPRPVVSINDMRTNDWLISFWNFIASWPWASIGDVASVLTVAIAVAAAAYFGGKALWRQVTARKEKAAELQRALDNERIAENKDKVLGWQLVGEEHLTLPTDELQALVDSELVTADDLVLGRMLLAEHVGEHGENEADEVQVGLRRKLEELRRAGIEHHPVFTGLKDSIASFQELTDVSLKKLEEKPN